jgi:ankyrin repeat protein
LLLIKDNYTALHIAVESAKPAVVETLLGFGAEVHVTGGKLRETPLHIAARVKDGDRCALMLLKSGAGPNRTTDDGKTPVHIAAKYGNVTCLDLLLEDNGDPLLKSHVSIFLIENLVCLYYIIEISISPYFV